MTSPNSVDFLQRAWETPEPHEIFRNNEVLITPDLKPAVPGQLLVVSRKPSWQEMSPTDIGRLYVIGEKVCRELEAVYQPTRGTGLARFGNDSPTPHLICYPRHAVEDGVLLYDKSRPKASDEQLAETQRIMQAQFENSDFAERIKALGGLSLA